MVKKNLPSNNDVNSVALPAFRLPAGKSTPILSLNSSRRRFNPSFDFALLLFV